MSVIKQLCRYPGTPLLQRKFLIPKGAAWKGPRVRLGGMEAASVWKLPKGSRVISPGTPRV